MATQANHATSEQPPGDPEARLFAAMFQAAADAILVTGAEGRVEHANPSAERMFQLTASQLIGAPIARLLQRRSPDDPHSELGHIAYRSDGTVFPVQVSIGDFELGGVHWSVRTIRDVSELADMHTQRDRLIQELRDREDSLREAASHDSLTGLANRAMFLESLDRALAAAERRREQVAVAFVDIDRFKQINDTRGHDVGDEVLRLVAHRIVEAIRAEDLAARLGGDEFTIMFPGSMSRADLRALLQRIQESVQSNLALRLGPIEASVSVGAAVFPDDARSGKALMRAADQAMYRVKRGGGHGVYLHSADIGSEARRRGRLERDLRRALSEDDLQVHYQPIIRLRDGSLVAAEALARWSPPGLDAVSPTLWIPMAEEMGLMDQVGSYVFHSAVEALQHWDEAGLSRFTVSVNASPLEFRAGLYASPRIEALLDRSLEPGRLQIELSEAALQEIPASVRGELDALRRAGVRTAVDDFGTGASTLATLLQFPADVLKLDTLIVQELPHNEVSRAIVDTLTALGQRLRMRISAEGIETVEQFDYLRAAGVELGQGYLIGRPMPAEAIPAWLRARTATAA